VNALSRGVADRLESPGCINRRLRKEGNGVGSDAATAARHTTRTLLEQIRIYATLVRSGFRRWATYRQATVAGAATNTVFGFVRCYVVLAVAAGAGGVAAGYDSTQLATYVWFGQGLLAVVLLWGWSELADRIRTGDVATDLLRPVSPVALYLATDLGRAGHALLFRFLPPVLVGAMVFDLFLPARPGTWPLFAISALLAMLICFGCRYLVNATGYWLLDIRGINAAWMFAGGVLGGLLFPLRFLPEPVWVTLYLATPFPSLLQIPLDVLVERDPTAIQVGLVGVQATWAVLILGACVGVQRRAERKLVIQGG
jgi:ABC-2 type transport system permease protein